MKQRPKTIPVVAAFLFAATAIAAVVGASLLFRNPLLDRLWELNRPAAALFHALGWMAGVLLLLLGAAAGAAGVGLLHGRKWAWWFTVILFAVQACGDVVSFFATWDFWRSASGTAISCAFLYALSRRSVRRYFGQRQQPKRLT